MNNDTPADAITQADRDAVSQYCVEVYGKNVEGRMVRDIQNGKADDHPLVQFAARHRTTSLAAQDGLVEALREIADPIGYIQKRAEDQGCKINGQMAVRLSNDPEYLKGIARAALASIEVKS